jgi:hypothetical protein
MIITDYVTNLLTILFVILECTPSKLKELTGKQHAMFYHQQPHIPHIYCLWVTGLYHLGLCVHTLCCSTMTKVRNDTSQNVFPSLSYMWLQLFQPVLLISEGSNFEVSWYNHQSMALAEESGLESWLSLVLLIRKAGS